MHDEHVGDPVARGASVLSGGARRRLPTDRYWPPTVLTDVPAHARIAVDETCGPSVVTIDSLAQTISLTNASPYGLLAAIVTADLNSGLEFADHVRTGWLNIDESTNYWEAHLPFGGRAGTHGIGRVGGGTVIAALTAYGASLRLRAQRLRLLGRVCLEQAHALSTRLGHDAPLDEYLAALGGASRRSQRPCSFRYEECHQAHRPPARARGIPRSVLSRQPRVARRARPTSREHHRPLAVSQHSILEMPLDRPGGDRALDVASDLRERRGAGAVDDVMMRAVSCSMIGPASSSSFM